MVIQPDKREALTYAFGHLVGSFYTDDATAGWSGELAGEVLAELGLSQEEIDRLEILAEYVYGNYNYTGEAEEYQRKIEAGEI